MQAARAEPWVVARDGAVRMVPRGDCREAQNVVEISGGNR